MYFIVTCKGRLKYLQQTIDSMVRQAESRVIVVDYDCPDKCGDWVNSAFGDSVKVIRVPNKQYFIASEARNCGFAALPKDAGWVCFIDSDIHIPPDFTEKFMPTLFRDPRPRSFYLCGVGGSVTGTVVVHRDDFTAVGGYDEVMSGYGSEDTDMYARLSESGCVASGYSDPVVTHIEHPQDIRTENLPCKEAALSIALNGIYKHMKIDVIRLTKNLNPSLEFRRSLYAMVAENLIQLCNTNKQCILTLELPQVGINRVQAANRKLVYEIVRSNNGLLECSGTSLD